MDQTPDDLEHLFTDVFLIRNGKETVTCIPPDNDLTRPEVIQGKIINILETEFTYSSWFVIIPHLILIAGFTLMTQFFTVNMFSFSIIRAVCAVLTMLVIFLLALRGILMSRSVKKHYGEIYKSHTIRSLIFLLLLLVIGIVNFVLYQNSALVSSSLLHFVVYCLCMAGLTVLAVSTFPLFRKEKV